MHVKRFEAATLPEALAQVREALGPDALVLSTRQVRRQGGLFGRFGRGVVEVTAAVDRDVRRAAVAPAPAAGASGPAAAPPAAPRVAPDASWRELRWTRALIEPLEAEVSALRRAVEQLGVAPGPAVPAPAAPLAAEIAELRRVARAFARPEPGASESPWTRRLVAAGIAREHAEPLVAEARLRASEGECEERALVQSLAARLDSRLAPPREDDPPRTLFVGPTGAGKTTSLAKVAAREPGAVGPALVSADAHRVGGDAALRAYAEGLELPFSVAVSEQALVEAAKRSGGRRLLVDTAGRSPRDAAALGELRRLRGALGRSVRVNLVVSATTKESDLARSVAWFRPLEPDGLVVTRLDESGDLGNLANLLLDGDAPPLTWLGAGQRVPDDLLVPDPHQLACRVLGVQP